VPQLFAYYYCQFDIIFELSPFLKDEYIQPVPVPFLHNISSRIL
jgi:hypothetical protein